MSFNKIKAMKNAERYLTQGKTQAAINEYKQVVENDPKDFNSRNMLGDLYIKADETQAAVNCYQEVAEHYNSQGFAKKAIAIYNKIYRLDPNCLEVAIKLAKLYQTRGSAAEARKHYQEIAKRYEQKGHKLEALSIWEKIAEIAPKDTEIYVKIADAYWQDDRKDDAAKAFIEAGKRFVEAETYESAVTSFSRSLEVNPEDFTALKGYVDSQLRLGYPEEGALALENIIEKNQYNTEINYLLMDCYFEMDAIGKAEEIILKLIEREPANYPKLLELVNIYLEKDDLDSATRILAMTSEHMLVGGEFEELLNLVNEVLARNPEHIAALRLLARYYGWQRDEAELQQTLERIAESAYLNGAIDDERFALSQYLLLAPHDSVRSTRLKEINNEFGFEEQTDERLLHTGSGEVPTFESFATLNQDEDSSAENGFDDSIDDEGSSAEDLSTEDLSTEDDVEAMNSDYEAMESVHDATIIGSEDIDLDDNQIAENSFEMVNSDSDQIVESGFEMTEDSDPIISKTIEDDDQVDTENDFATETLPAEEHEIKSDLDLTAVEPDSVTNSASSDEAEPINASLSASDEVRIDEEVESIKFYLDQGYTGLAEKSLVELEKDFGQRAEFIELREQLLDGKQDSVSTEEKFASGHTDETSQVVSDSLEPEGPGPESQVSSSPENLQESSQQVIEKQEQVVAEDDNSLPEESTFRPASEAIDEVEVNPPISESVDSEGDSVADEKQTEMTSPDDNTGYETARNLSVEETVDSKPELPDGSDVEREYTNSFDDFKDAIGLDESEEVETDDYEEHYQHAVVYQEMGLLEEAIREFQDAVNCIDANDGTKRFLNCCSLLGHCFMEKGMANLALSWFEKAAESPSLSENETLGVYYEIANAHQVNNEPEKALEKFELIYALDVDYRDIGERLDKLRQNALTPA